MVRTDLDRFDGELANMLMDHGEAVTLASLRPKSWAVLPEGCRLELAADEKEDEEQEQEQAPAPELAEPGDETEEPGLRPFDAAKAAIAASREDERRKAIAGKAAFRTFRRLPFDLEDFGTLFLLYLVIAGLVGGSGYGVSKYLDYKENLKIQKEIKEADYQNRISALSEQHDADEDKFALLKGATAAANIPRLREILGLPPLVPGQGQTTSGPPPIVPPTQAQIQPASVAAPARKHDERIYIQFAGTIKREEIIALNKGLRAVDWDVQGSSGERTPNSAGLNEVRYGGDNEDAAQALADAINRLRIAGKPIVGKTVTVKHVPIVGERNLELWISR